MGPQFPKICVTILVRMGVPIFLWVCQHMRQKQLLDGCVKFGARSSTKYHDLISQKWVYLVWKLFPDSVGVFAHY